MESFVTCVWPPDHGTYGKHAVRGVHEDPSCPLALLIPFRQVRTRTLASSRTSYGLNMDIL